MDYPGPYIVGDPTTNVVGGFRYIDSSGECHDMVYSTTTFWNALQGVWASSQPCAMTFTRKGNTVTVFVGQTIQNSTVGAPAAITAAAPVPDDYTPGQEQFQPILVEDDGTRQIGLIKIETTGELTIYSSVSETPFTRNGGETGIPRSISVTYTGR
jgi:hypothetical protein